MDYLDILGRETKIIAREGVKILELGSLFGASTIVLAKIAKKYGGEVTCIDMFFRTSFYINLSGRDLLPQVKCIRGTTQSILPTLRDNSFDVIFVDAGHTYKEVIFDLYHANRVLKPNGLLIGDDLNSNIDWVIDPEGHNFMGYSQEFFEKNKNKYGIELHGVPGTVYCGVFKALAEFCDTTGFEFKRGQNL